MAITQYQVTIQKQVLSFNPSEQPWFDGVTAARLIATGYATAVGTPPPVVQVLSGAPIDDVVDDGGVPVPASAADRAILGSGLGVLPGDSGRAHRRPPAPR